MWWPYPLSGLLLLGLIFLVMHLKKKENKELSLKYAYKEAKLSDMENEFLGLINVYRKTKNAKMLKADEHAGLVAFKHNATMVLNDRVSHTGYPDRVEELMVHGALEVGEITGGYYTSVSGAFKAFLASERHEPTIKSIKYNVCGLDVMKNDKGKLFVTCMFMKI